MSTPLTAPVTRRGQMRGVLQVLNKRDGAFDERDEKFVTQLADQIGRALDYTTLRGGAAVYEMIVRAAQTDATVLLHGETGTWRFTGTGIS